MEFILEEIQVKDEPDPDKCDMSPTSDSKLNVNVECSVRPIKMKNMSPDMEFHRTLQVKTPRNSNALISGKPAGTIRHVDLDLSDMFLVEKKIKVEPINTEISSTGMSDPLADVTGSRRSDEARVRPRKEKRFKCELCGEIFVNINNLIQHKLMHTEEMTFKCEVCEKSFTTSEEIRRHKLTHARERPYKCDVCNKTYLSLVTLAKHTSLHTNENQNKCDICGRRFLVSNQLTLHISKHMNNTGEKIYKCDVCDRGFMTAQGRAVHSAKHRDKNQRHKCESCGKEFTRLSNLFQHKLTHAEDKPKKSSFKCVICGKKFLRYHYLNQHKKSHTRVKSYKCELCEKVFQSFSYFTTHKLLHKGEICFKCETCGKNFAGPCNLGNHKRVKTLQCEICGKKFCGRFTLAEHKRLHTGEMPHKCKTCGMSFGSYYLRSKHNLETHKKPKLYMCDVYSID